MEPTPSLKSRTPYVVLLLVALVGAGLVAAFFLWPRPLPPVAPVADAGTPLAAAERDAGPAVDVAEGDAKAKEAAKGLVPEEWLAGGDAVRRFVAAVSSIAEGDSPRAMLTFLAPGDTFIVDEEPQPKEKIGPKTRRKMKGMPAVKPKLFISEKNDARYDKVAQAIGHIDPVAAAQRYKQLKPYIDAAYREIAPPGKTFDGALNAAIDRLASVPITDGPREVVQMEKGTGYAWADPKLEALSPAEKHLLRMGPKNARAVVAQLKAFQAALKD